MSDSVEGILPEGVSVVFTRRDDILLFKPAEELSDVDKETMRRMIHTAFSPETLGIRCLCIGKGDSVVIIRRLPND